MEKPSQLPSQKWEGKASVDSWFYAQVSTAHVAHFPLKRHMWCAVCRVGDMQNEKNAMRCVAQRDPCSKGRAACLMVLETKSS